jgi:amino acid permease
MAMGKLGEVSALVSLCLYLIGGLIAYSDIVGNYFSQALIFIFKVQDPGWYLDPRFITVMAGILLIFPLSCLKDMRILAKTSLAGMVCMTYVTVLTVVDYFVDQEVSQSASVNLVRFKIEFFSAFSTILFAFTNQFTIVALIPVLIRPTPWRRTKLIIVSSVATTVIYLLVGGFGYAHFGDAIEGNILTAPDHKTWPYAIAQLAVGFVIILSYPLLANPAKASIDQVFSTCFGKSSRWKRLGLVRHFGISALLVVISTVVAITLAKQVLLILGVFTALCGSLIMFIFPSLYFLRLSKNRYATSPAERILAYFNIGFGLIVLVMGTYAGVALMIKSFMNY